MDSNDSAHDSTPQKQESKNNENLKTEENKIGSQSQESLRESKNIKPSPSKAQTPERDASPNIKDLKVVKHQSKPSSSDQHALTDKPKQLRRTIDSDGNEFEYDYTYEYEYDDEICSDKIVTPSSKVNTTKVLHSPSNDDEILPPVSKTLPTPHLAPPPKPRKQKEEDSPDKNKSKTCQ